MTKIKREDYVAQSFLYFLTSIILSIATLVIGTGYLIINHEFIDFPKVALKLAGTEAILTIITLICWRSYIADRQLLTSSKNKYMNAKSSKIDTRGINVNDIDNDS